MKVDRYSLEGFLRLLEEHSYTDTGDYELFDSPKEETFTLAKVYYEKRLKEDKPEIIDAAFRMVKSVIFMGKNRYTLRNVHFTRDGNILAEDNDGVFDLDRYVRAIEKAREEEDITKARESASIGKKSGIPTTKYPEEFTMSLTNVVSNLPRIDAPITRDVMQAAKLPVGDNVSVYVQLGFDKETAKENGITIPNRIVDFDLEVLNAIVSLLEAGNRLFWPEQIASVLKGKKAEETKTHDSEIERIIASVERLRFTAVYIDATEQFAHQKYKVDPERIVEQNDGQHAVYDENILYLRGARIINLQNGKSVRAWEYAGNKPPVLHEYSKRLKQITKVDIRLLDTGIRSTETITVAKTYLLREISKMKRGTRNNTKMLYSTIFKACGIDKPENDTPKAKNTNFNHKKRLKANITTMCDSWKEQGFISGYAIFSDGIQIDLQPESDRKSV